MTSPRERLDLLVVSRSYPAPGDLYRYPFVHRRVRAYQAAGHRVRVFRPDAGPARVHRFDGVECVSGGAEALREIVRGQRPCVAAIHGLDEKMAPTVAPLFDEGVPIRAWLHGSEIPDFARQKANWLSDPRERNEQLEQIDRRIDYWNSMAAAPPDRFGLVFVSHTSVDMMRRDVDPDAIPHSVIPNPIDTELFDAPAPAPEQRFRVLMVRPFDHWSYGNDLAVRAIERLKGDPRITFTIIGDGPLFEETLAPIRDDDRVTIRRTFLTQPQIAAEHRRHGLFLVPTRLDTQGVSRDEAMSSGLVPITNAIAAVREFVPDNTGWLAPPEDAEGLAEGIRAVAEEMSHFEDRSQRSAQHIRDTVASERIVPEELRALRSAQRSSDDRKSGIDSPKSAGFD